MGYLVHQPLLQSPLHMGFFVGFVMGGAVVGLFLGGAATGFFFMQPPLPSPLHCFTGFFVVGAVVCTTDIIFRTQFTFFQST
jgi:hypothetical protein